MNLTLELICLLVFVGAFSVAVFIPDRVIQVIGAIAGIVYVIITLVRSTR